MIINLGVDNDLIGLRFSDKAKQLLGWEPAFAGKDGFRRGLARTAEWFSKPENLAAYKTDRYNR